MKVPNYWLAAGVLAVAATAARAGDEVPAAGEPALTREVADRKIDYWEWVFGLQLDDRQREEFRKLQADEWPRRDKEWRQRWVNYLAAWRTAVTTDGAATARLRDSARLTALDGLTRGEGDAMGQWLLSRQVAAHAAVAARRDPARDAEAIRMAMLKLQFERRQQFLRDLSNVQAQHHETMMVIIRNIKPAGRYEYNASTGRYDRYVPNP